MKMVKVTQKYGFKNEIEMNLYINIDRIVTMSIDPDDKDTIIELDDRDDCITSIVESPEEILNRMKHAEDF